MLPAGWQLSRSLSFSAAAERTPAARTQNLFLPPSPAQPSAAQAPAVEAGFLPLSCPLEMQQTRVNPAVSWLVLVWCAAAAAGMRFTERWPTHSSPLLSPCLQPLLSVCLSRRWTRRRSRSRRFSQSEGVPHTNTHKERTRPVQRPRVFTCRPLP